MSKKNKKLNPVRNFISNKLKSIFSNSKYQETKDWLSCDFHIHTNFSDGELPLREVIDLFGKNGLDVISITDHILDKDTLVERKKNNQPIWSIEEKDFSNYLNILQEEKKRAWKKYKMLVIPGTEITNNSGKYHILAIDIKKYIDPSLSVERIIKEIHEQGGIAIACHPHRKTSEGENGNQYSAHLWEEHEKYVNLFDAWEVANRDDLFNVIGLKKFNYIANSDFHQSRHFYSWKTLLKSVKNIKAVKTAISKNEKIAIYLHRK